MTEPQLVLQIGEKLPLGELWGTEIGFILLVVASIGVIGLSGRSLAVGSMGAFLTFGFYAVETQNAFLQPLLYVVVVTVIVGTAMKLWRSEGFESGG